MCSLFWSAGYIYRYAYEIVTRQIFFFLYTSNCSLVTSIRQISDFLISKRRESFSMIINDSLNSISDKNSNKFHFYLSRSLLMSTKNRAYNPMCEDGFDNKIPLHNDEAFEHGIQFKVKVKFQIELIKKILDYFLFSLLDHSKYLNHQVVVKS